MIGTVAAPISGLVEQSFMSATDSETRENLAKDIAPAIESYTSWFNALPPDQQERLRDIGAAGELITDVV